MRMHAVRNRFIRDGQEVTRKGSRETGRDAGMEAGWQRVTEGG